MGNMRYLTDLDCLKQYLSRSSNVLDQIKQLPYKAKKSLVNVGIELSFSTALGAGSGFSYWYLLREGLHLSTGVPYVDGPIAILIAGSVSGVYANHLLKKWGWVTRGQTKLEEFK